MKWFSRAKSFTVLFALAAQVFLPAFNRDALATPFSLTPEKFPLPPVKSLLTPTVSPFVIQVEPVIVQHKSTARTEARLKKLGETLKKNVNIDLETNTPKAPNESVGKCARYSVHGFKAVGINLESADSKDLPPNLLKAGFKKIRLKKNETPRAGDVVVISPPNTDHPFGHTAVYGPDNQWYSDFAQKGVWPYEIKMQESLLTYFRHDAFSAVDVQTEYSQNYTMDINPAYFMRDRISELNTPWELARTEGLESLDWLQGKLATASPHQKSSKKLMKASAPEKSSLDANHFEKLTKPTIAAQTYVRQRESLATSPPLTKTEELHAQWHEARKAVLKRNMALKQGTTDKLAEKKLRASVKNMYGCVADVMELNPVDAFKAMRYICNKCDESKRLASIDKRTLLDLISKNLDRITNADEDLGRQAANYVAKKARKPASRPNARLKQIRAHEIA